GKSIGRFWEIGPQQTLFMPGCWLKKGKNEIIVLDLKGPEQATIAGLDQPILDQLRQEAPLTNRKDGETLQLAGEQPVYTGSFAAGNGWQEVRFDKPIPARYFCLEALNAQDGKDRAAMAELYLLDEQGKPLSRQNWKISYANSEETYGGNFTADKVFDLQESTYWQTGGKEKYPHQIVVDTNADTKISGFRYLPRAEAGAPGMIKDFRVFVKSAPFQY
ncbi:MAG: discoidin domain-containing protein, partial [Tannerellaceae bacterium]